MSSPDSPMRRAVRRTSLAVTALSGLWVLALLVTGGIDATILGVSISSHEPLRPVLFASIGLTVFILSGGEVWLRPPSIAAALSRVGPRRVAAALALATTALGVAYSTTVAGGADSYGYVSQADLWLSGSLKVKEPWSDAAPWPMKRWSFAPLGYRPVEDDGVTAMVPTYSPGLPLLMAGAKAAFGHEAVFWIVPICGGLLVWTTFAIGCRLGSQTAGVLGAWLVATSPAQLIMLVSPMSDVPAAAAWAVAFYFMCGRTSAAALAAGLASAVAILIRPNLAMLVAPLGLWYLIRAVDDAGQRRAWLVRGALYAAGVLPGIAIVAAVNQHLYGSPTASGYGDLGGLFSLDNVAPNARRYPAWLAHAHTPLAYAGVAAIFLPFRRIWSGLPHRGLIFVMATFSVLLWSQYFAYIVFDAWWYLRFMLPTWPFIMIGLASVALSIFGPAWPKLRFLAIVAVVAMGLNGYRTAGRERIFDIWHGDRRYVGAAQLVQKYLPRESVLFAMQHSGSLKYYSGRLMARYDFMDDGWMGRAVEWFAGQGLRVFLVIDGWELAEVKRQFASEPGVMAVVNRPAVFIYRDVLVYDLGRPNEANAPVEIFDSSGSLRSVPPAPSTAPLPR